jgi:hypothetical protein
LVIIRVEFVWNLLSHPSGGMQGKLKQLKIDFPSIGIYLAREVADVIDSHPRAWGLATAVHLKDIRFDLSDGVVEPEPQHGPGKSIFGSKFWLYN